MMKNIDNKLFYISDCGKIISYNKITETYCIQNNINLDDKRISRDTFNKLKTKQIKRQEYSRLMNIYFKDIKETWEYDGTSYQSIDNFESNDIILYSNYKLGTTIPYHNLSKTHGCHRVIFVYHWGKVYYHDISYNGYKQGCLYDIKTHKFARWCQLKHCAPIFNKTTKKIM